jgi:hypothetical protein
MRRCARPVLKGRSKSGNVYAKLQIGIGTVVSQIHSQRFCIPYWPLYSGIADISCYLLVGQQNTDMASCFTYTWIYDRIWWGLLPFFCPCFTYIAFYLPFGLPNYIHTFGHPLQLSVTYTLLIMVEFVSDPSDLVFQINSLALNTCSHEIPHIALQWSISSNKKEIITMDVK